MVGMLGDLAFYHDMNGLWHGRGISATILVLNNGGGAIFSYLPQSRLASFERNWLTPGDLDFELAAKLYRLDFQRVVNQGDFAPALTRGLANPGLSIIEIMLDRMYSMSRHQAYWEAVSAI